MNLTLSDSYGPKYLKLENNNDYGFSFSNEGTIYCFRSDNKEEIDSWFNILRESLSY